MAFRSQMWSALIQLGCLAMMITSFFFTSQLDWQEPNNCKMSYFFVNNKPMSWSPPHDTYKMYRYFERPPKTRYNPETAEAQDPAKFNAYPVLFIHGNAGSYHQARSVAQRLSSFQNRNNIMQPNRLDFYSIDFLEEQSALSGSLLYGQAEYAALCVETLLQKYRVPNLIIVAHSMGGIVARGIFLHDRVPFDSVAGIVTLGTPHQGPVVQVDAMIGEMYSEINAFWLTHAGQLPPLISIAGGLRDNLVEASLTSLHGIVTAPEQGFTVQAAAIPSIAGSVDHQCLCWCFALVDIVAETVYRWSPLTRDDAVREMSVLRDLYIQDNLSRQGFSNTMIKPDEEPNNSVFKEQILSITAQQWQHEPRVSFRLSPDAIGPILLTFFSMVKVSTVEVCPAHSKHEHATSCRVIAVSPVETLKDSPAFYTYNVGADDLFLAEDLSEVEVVFPLTSVEHNVVKNRFPPSKPDKDILWGVLYRVSPLDPVLAEQPITTPKNFNLNLGNDAVTQHTLYIAAESEEYLDVQVSLSDISATEWRDSVLVHMESQCVSQDPGVYTSEDGWDSQLMLPGILGTQVTVKDIPNIFVSHKELVSRKLFVFQRAACDRVVHVLAVHKPDLDYTVSIQRPGNQAWMRSLWAQLSVVPSALFSTLLLTYHRSLFSPASLPKFLEPIPVLIGVTAVSLVTDYWNGSIHSMKPWYLGRFSMTNDTDDLWENQPINTRQAPEQFVLTGSLIFTLFGACLMLWRLLASCMSCARHCSSLKKKKDVNVANDDIMIPALDKTTSDAAAFVTSPATKHCSSWNMLLCILCVVLSGLSFVGMLWPSLVEALLSVILLPPKCVALLAATLSLVNFVSLVIRQRSFMNPQHLIRQHLLCLGLVVTLIPLLIQNITHTVTSSQASMLALLLSAVGSWFVPEAVFDAASKDTKDHVAWLLVVIALKIAVFPMHVPLANSVVSTTAFALTCVVFFSGARYYFHISRNAISRRKKD